MTREDKMALEAVNTLGSAYTVKTEFNIPGRITIHAGWVLKECYDEFFCIFRDKESSDIFFVRVGKSIVDGNMDNLEPFAPVIELPAPAPPHSPSPQAELFS